MDDRTELNSAEKAEMRGLVLAGAARADSIRRRRSRIAVSVSAVVVVAGIAVGAAFASGALGRGSAAPVAPAPAPAVTEPQAPIGQTHPFGGIAAFDRPSTASDALPTGLTDEAKQSLRSETARFVGEYEQVAYWIAQGEDPGAVCIVVWPRERADSWGTACGGVVLTTAKPGLFEAQLGPAGSAPDGWIELDENLSVNPNP